MALTTSDGSIARPKILLLEDDPGVRRSLQLLLQGQGYDVRSHAAGGSLLADANSKDAVCLVADFFLDDIDGVAVLSRLREDNWLGPAILITGFPSADLRERAAEAGYAAVLEKPLRQNALVDLVSLLVTHRDVGKS
jgi:FixJ family two-component response regulator